MDYNFSEIEKKWRVFWEAHQIYKTDIDHSKPKFYVLDMFPYPSGAGLHVGHPLGYIASDIYARYKRQKGFNVLHPMGYDAFGLPAEQYAIQTGQHPAVTTAQNITRYREQMDQIGFSFDWNRELKTSDPDYYKWTQWTFIQMFHSFYNYELRMENEESGAAQPISELIKHFERKGTAGLNAAQTEQLNFTAEEWNAWEEKQQQEVLMNYRLAYLAETNVNWCEQLGTVLANDEVLDGLSIRGGYPVIQKKMKQWSLRVSAYAKRLLEGLNKIDWTESLKETQRNWIGRSEGAEMVFHTVKTNHYPSLPIRIFTTRADTIYGVTFMVLAPESLYVEDIVTPEQKNAVQEYLEITKKRTERERIADRKVTGVFSGSYAINPISGTQIPIWISDYVLAAYGTGAIMAVPAHDSRDYAFAKHFKLPIISLIEGADVGEESFDAKEGIMCNSPITNDEACHCEFESKYHKKLVLNGLTIKEAIATTKKYIEENGLGKVKVNYRLRDAIFSRQRYWGEPFPIYYKDGMPYTIAENDLPLELPEVDKFLPTETGEPPLGRAKHWEYCNEFSLELSTMPGFAGSSAYYLRYEDPHNEKTLVSKEANNYWGNVDLYLGGSEHATGHLIYSRFWNKFLYDLGIVKDDEPFKKLLNQGMIQGRSNFVYRIKNTNTFVSYNLKNQYDATEIHVDVNIVSNDILDIEAFKTWRPEFANAQFILEDGKYICGWAIEKMSKSMYNVVNPDDLVAKYGADTLRLYEMFLGPIELSKPWDTNGIEGVFRFIRKFWKLFHNMDNQWNISEVEPTEKEYKILHKTIKKIEEDNERFAFNTAVSAFMICCNELIDLKCNKRAILKPLTILLSAYAPHICEELWQLMGHDNSIVFAEFPKYDEKYLIETTFNYPVSFNGKTRFQKSLPLNVTAKEVEEIILQEPEAQKWLEGKTPQKVIFVQGKIINIVI